MRINNLLTDPGNNPTSQPCQIILFVWSVAAFIIATSYSAVLVSFLTTLKPVFPFRTFEEIIHRPDWHIVTNKNSAIKDNLRVRNFKIFNSEEFYISTLICIN